MTSHAVIGGEQILGFVCRLWIEMRLFVAD